jgi:predicted acyl esterase
MRIRQGMCALVLAVVAMALPGAAQAAEPIFEKYKVPTVDGAEINVEVMRPAGNPDAPVVLTYSPYNTLSETNSPNLANDDIGQATWRRATRGRSRTSSAPATRRAAGTTAG